MILILCGKSACGKDAIQKAMVARGFQPIVSLTTRPMRAGEMPGKTYHFVNRQIFTRLIEWDELIEYRSYNTIYNNNSDTWFYGIRKFSLDKTTDYVVILDIEGARAFLDYFGRQNCFVTYVEVPDSIREARARQRGSFDEAEWNRRLEADTRDFSKDLVDEVKSIVVFNTTDLSDCVEKIEHEFDETKRSFEDAD